MVSRHSYRHWSYGITWNDTRLSFNSSDEMTSQTWPHFTRIINLANHSNSPAWLYSLWYIQLDICVSNAFYKYLFFSYFIFLMFYPESWRLQEQLRRNNYFASDINHSITFLQRCTSYVLGVIKKSAIKAYIFFKSVQSLLGRIFTNAELSFGLSGYRR